MVFRRPENEEPPAEDPPAEEPGAAEEEEAAPTRWVRRVSTDDQHERETLSFVEFSHSALQRASNFSGCFYQEVRARGSC